MAETTTNKARRVCEKMGLDEHGRNSYEHKLMVIQPYFNIDNYALAMLCVAEGVTVMGTRDTFDILVSKHGSHRPTLCTKDQLIRTIYDVYLEG